MNLHIDPETDGDAEIIAFSIVVILEEETMAENRDITASPTPKDNVQPNKLK